MSSLYDCYTNMKTTIISTVLLGLCFLSPVIAAEEAGGETALSQTDKKGSAPQVKVSTEEPTVVKQYGEQMVAAVKKTYEIEDAEACEYLLEKVELVRAAATRCYRTQEAYLRYCLADEKAEHEVPAALLARMDANYAWLFESFFNYAPWVESQAEKRLREPDEEPFTSSICIEETNKMPHEATTLPAYLKDYGQNRCMTTAEMNLRSAAPSNAWVAQVAALVSLLVDYHELGLYPFGGSCRSAGDGDSELSHAEKGARLIVQMDESFEAFRYAFGGAYDAPNYMGTMHFALMSNMSDSVIGYQEYFMRALCKLEPVPSVRKDKALAAEAVETCAARLNAASREESFKTIYRKNLLSLLEKIEAGADVSFSPRHLKGNTALHYASALGDYEAVRMLLEAGANPNARTHKGATPLKCLGPDPTGAIRSLLLLYGAR